MADVERYTFGGMRKQGVNHCRVVSIQPRMAVASIGASHRFYRDALGFKSNHTDPTDSDGFVIVQRDGHGIQLVVAREGHRVEQTTVWIQVVDAAAEHARISAVAPIEWGPEVYWYGCREFAVLDPDGNRIIFSSPTNDVPTCPES